MKVIISIFVLLCVIVSYKQVDADAADAAEKVKAGIEASKGISELLQTDRFVGAIRNISTKITPFLGALGPAVALITLFLPESPSPELIAIKNGFAEVDASFDQTFAKLEELKNFIQETAVKLSYGGCEVVIILLAEEMNNFLAVDTSNSEALEQRKNIFLAFYEASFDLCAKKLWTGMVDESLVLAINIPEAAMEFTQNDRKKVEKLMSAVTQLILIGVKVHLTYLRAKEYLAIFNEEVTAWDTRIQQMLDHIETVDTRLMDKYHEQSEKDVKKMAAEMHGDSNSNLAEAAFQELQTKFDWRDWYVIVFNDVSGENSNTFRVCEGHRIFHHHGFNIVIGSIDKNIAIVDLTVVTSVLANVKTYENIDGFPVALGAYYIMENYFPEVIKNDCDYAVIGIVEKTADPRVRIAAGRNIRVEGPFHIISTIR